MKKLLEKYRVSIGIFAATLFLGLLLGVELRSNYESKAQLNEEQSQVEMYNAMLENEKEKSEKLTNKLEKANKRNEKLLKVSKNDKKKKKDISRRLKKVRFLAGMTDVSGEGVTVILDDASKDDLTDDTEEYTDYVIHDIDVIRVLNVLRAAGAQAISINGERLTSESSQICAGSTIMVNKNKYVLPFEIKAIGDADKLYDAFVESEIYTELVFFKMKADVEKSYDLLLKAGTFK